MFQEVKEELEELVQEEKEEKEVPELGLNYSPLSFLCVYH